MSTGAGDNSNFINGFRRLRSSAAAAARPILCRLAFQMPQSPICLWITIYLDMMEDDHDTDIYILLLHNINKIMYI